MTATGGIEDRTQPAPGVAMVTGKNRPRRRIGSR
jgi:hypothetical protein